VNNYLSSNEVTNFSICVHVRKLHRCCNLTVTLCSMYSNDTRLFRKVISFHFIHPFCEVIGIRHIHGTYSLNFLI